MTVKPAGLLSFLRKEAVRRGYAGKEIAPDIEKNQKRLHKERYNAAALIKQGHKAADIALEGLADAPVPVGMEQGPPTYPSDEVRRFRKAFSGFLGQQTNFSSCFTCCECTNSCPVARSRSLFDPMRIVRMAAFGLREELLASPAIWLCLGCRTCTSACRQLVRGHMVLSRAQELAVEEGFVDADFHENWLQAQTRIFSEYIGRIDSILDSGSFAGSDRKAGGTAHEAFHKKPIWGQADTRYGLA
jgi:heterodisulfide reductase subunit C